MSRSTIIAGLVGLGAGWLLWRSRKAAAPGAPYFDAAQQTWTDPLTGVTANGASSPAAGVQSPQDYFGPNQDPSTGSLPPGALQQDGGPAAGTCNQDMSCSQAPMVGANSGPVY